MEILLSLFKLVKKLKVLHSRQNAIEKHEVIWTFYPSLVEANKFGRITVADEFTPDQIAYRKGFY